MISLTCFASCHACAIRSRRLGPIPHQLEFCGSVLDHASTSAPNRPTTGASGILFKHFPAKALLTVVWRTLAGRSITGTTLGTA